MSRYARPRDRRLFLVRESAPDYGRLAADEEDALDDEVLDDEVLDEDARDEDDVLDDEVPDDVVPDDEVLDEDARDEDDVLDDLADEITTLTAHIHAATARLLELIAEFDRRRGWEREGHRSCAHWLAFRTGIDLGTAREKVRAARALTRLPETAASMARGELSFSKVRALTRVATPESESDLLELARGCTTAQTEKIARAWRKHSRATEADLERELHESRTLSVFPDDEGMYLVRGKLPAEVGALLMRAIEAASDAIYRGEDLPGERDEDTVRAAARRRADALALLAERAMAAGFGPGEGPGDEAEDPSDDSTPISGTRAERYQVVLHVSAETLEGDLATSVESEAEGDEVPWDEASGRSHLEDGTRVSAETSRRLSCDAAVVRVTERSTAEGLGRIPMPPGPEILSVGRRTRTIPPALRRALDVRDGGCRFPGCGLRFTDAHHVKHWADGGETSLDNCLLLCRHHHRLVHEGAWRVRWAGAGQPEFIDPRGGSHYDGRWQAPQLPAELRAAVAAGRTSVTRALAEGNRQRGHDPGPLTASARWKREQDIPDAVYFRALEAAV